MLACSSVFVIAVPNDTFMVICSRRYKILFNWFHPYAIYSASMYIYIYIYTVYIQYIYMYTTTTTNTTTTAQITMHAFSICGTALGKRTPPLPSHSASYNITANHHCHHLDHHSTSYNACIQYMRHCFRKKQTTSASYCGLGPAPAPFRPPHVPRSTCAQWWKIRTTSASYRGSKTTLPPLACTMQQAHVSLHKGMPLNWGYGQKFNGMPLCKLQVLAASCTPMVAV